MQGYGMRECALPCVWPGGAGCTRCGVGLLRRGWARANLHQLPPHPGPPLLLPNTQQFKALDNAHPPTRRHPPWRP